MKKIITAVIATMLGVLSSFCLWACGNSVDSGDPDKDAPPRARVR